jgi:hypothetical protein
MIISIMNASGSALPSGQFAKKPVPDLIRPHASPLKMRPNYEPAAFSHAAGWEPAHNMPRRRRFCQRGGPSTSIARRSARRAAMARRRARFWNPALREAFQNGFQVDSGVNLR